MSLSRVRLRTSRNRLSGKVTRRIRFDGYLSIGFEKSKGCILLLRNRVSKRYGKGEEELFFWIGDSNFIGYKSPDGFSMVFDSASLLGGMIKERVWRLACTGIFPSKADRKGLK